MTKKTVQVVKEGLHPSVFHFKVLVFSVQERYRVCAAEQLMKLHACTTNSVLFGNGAGIRCSADKGDRCDGERGAIQVGVGKRMAHRTTSDQVMVLPACTRHALGGAWERGGCGWGLSKACAMFCGAFMVWGSGLAPQIPGQTVCVMSVLLCAVWHHAAVHHVCTNCASRCVLSVWQYSDVWCGCPALHAVFFGDRVKGCSCFCI